MLRGSLALAIVMCTSACFARDEPSEDGAFTPADNARATITAGIAEPHDEYSICDHLPDEAPCSLLCDRDVLVDAYVPENSCAVFVCRLTDGATVTFHACRH